MTDWLSSGDWGRREQSIPGEWAMLVLIIVAGGALAFLVLWFTMLRHERTVLHRARCGPATEPHLDSELLESKLLGGGEGSISLLEPVAEADTPADGDDAGGGAAEPPEAENQDAGRDDSRDDGRDDDVKADPEPADNAENETETESETEPETEDAPKPDSESAAEREPEPAASADPASA